MQSVCLTRAQPGRYGGVPGRQIGSSRCNLLRKIAQWPVAHRPKPKLGQFSFQVADVGLDHRPKRIIGRQSLLNLSIKADRFLRSSVKA
jgi:hypothetical protein